MVSDEDRYNAYCKITALLAVTKDANRIIDALIAIGWRPTEKE